MSSSNYPLPTQSSLHLQYLGQPLSSLPTPSAVIDRAIVRRNCNAMLQVCKELDVGFRAHIKSHKTLELSKLQVGSDPSTPAHFVVSTIIEAENLLPFLLDCVAIKRSCSVIYGVPIAPSNVSRLVQLASKLPPWTLNILLDNINAFASYQQQKGSSTWEIGTFVKIDTGYHRAGIQTSSPSFEPLVNAVIHESGNAFRGFYSHFGHSYGGNSEDDAAEGLLEELWGLKKAAAAVPTLNFDSEHRNGVTLTVGATPTATAAQNILSSSSPKANEVRELITQLRERGFRVELHAGVYPLLDLQQVATHARPSSSAPTPSFMPLAKEAIGLKLLVEVSSVYAEREKPEALISAGSLAFGREPCKSYPGWGIVSPSLGNQHAKSVYDDSKQGNESGWIIGRISQEHGILTWEGERALCSDLEIGQKLLVWPNHACVAGAGFGWYVVVDSDSATEPGDNLPVVDVWVRWRGW
ncbi:hypothetical protein K491DRAFT_754483 [Lophiostoma macrostomum CBS 122681]|uniref:D-serine dehydratase n=1 Tax=Lophiostoma macrostomum CBS 122681 TaxID=1314788 RepID=A0A6A6TMJ7_9PLEO|nr:hypothetical protein K491DRAFT_754483 [Lophiostoma macrostomum CBS 122681]